MAPFLAYAREKVDGLKAAGTAAGEAIKNAMLTAFVLVKEGRVGELMGVGLHVAISGAIDALFRGASAIVGFLATALPPVFSAAIAILRDPNFWQGISNALQGAGVLLGIEIQKSLPFGVRKSDAYIKDMETLASVDMMIARKKFGEAKGGDVAKAGAEGLVAGSAEFMRVMTDWIPSKDLVEAKAAWQSIQDSVTESVEKIKEKFAVPEVKEGTKSKHNGEIDEATPEAKDKKAFSAPTVLTTALGRIGGGGFGMTFMPMLAEQRIANGFLRQVADSTKKMAAKLQPAKAIV